MLRIADKVFDSHLFTGTGKFASPQLMVDAIRESGSQLVTLALKRVDLRHHSDAILAPLLEAGVTLLPNTSGAKTAEEAIFAAQLAREALGTRWLKLEIHPDARWLLPDPIETLKAAEKLVQQGLESLLAGRTSVVIAHRLSTVLTADRVLVVSDGRVVEDGSPAALVEAGGRFAAMAQAWEENNSTEG